MAITNEERREVAARLREHQHCDVGSPTYEGGMIASWLRLKEALDAKGCDSQEDHTMMFGYLADLIEPEERTCRWKHIEGTWFMSECGKRYDRVVPDNYCPNCGARVID